MYFVIYNYSHQKVQEEVIKFVKNSLSRYRVRISFPPTANKFSRLNFSFARIHFHALMASTWKGICCED